MTDHDHARLGISVPNRTGSAVERNRWKRLLRETFRLHQQMLGSLDILVIPTRPPGKLRRQEVEKQFLALLRDRPEGKST